MGNAAQLATSAVDKLTSGFRLSILRQYRRMWSDFIAFQVAAWLLSYQVNVHLLLAFLRVFKSKWYCLFSATKPPSSHQGSAYSTWAKYQCFQRRKIVPICERPQDTSSI